MQDKNITFILGAGASAGYGFPTGAQLKESILYNLRWIFLRVIDDYISFKQIPLALKFRRLLKQSSLPTIDSFLTSIVDDVELVRFGKAQIINQIFKAQKLDESPFYSLRLVRAFKLKKSRRDWYRLFFNQITSDCYLREKFSTPNINIITFNYDLTLEQYSRVWLKKMFIGNDRLFLAKYNDFTEHIHHVYGSIFDDFQDDLTKQWYIGSNFYTGMSKWCATSVTPLTHY